MHMKNFVAGILCAGRIPQLSIEAQLSQLRAHFIPNVCAVLSTSHINVISADMHELHLHAAVVSSDARYA